MSEALQLVLFVTELGGGRGHVRRLERVASLAKQRGYRVALAHCSGERLKRELSELSAFDLILDGPAFPRLRNPPKVLEVSGLASTLAKVGFIDRRIIQRMIASWHSVFAKLEPAFIVGDFAPYARLASLERYPFIMVGSGFSIPTASGLFPFTLQNNQTDPSTICDRILDQVNVALGRFGTPDIQDCSDCLRGRWNAVGCLPCLDPVPHRPAAEYVGPFNPVPVDVRESAEDFRAAYAYLQTVSDRDRVALSELTRIGLKVDLFGLEETDQLSSGIRQLTKPQTLHELIKRYAVVLHHGGLGVSTACLLSGIPQLITPRFLEAYMTARKLETMGCAAILRQGESFLDVPLGHLASDRATAARDLARANAMAWVGSQNWQDRLVGMMSEAVAA